MNKIYLVLLVLYICFSFNFNIINSAAAAERTQIAESLKQFHKAIKDGDLDTIEKLINSGIVNANTIIPNAWLVNMRGSTDLTPLEIAISNTQKNLKAVVQLLIDKGADINFVKHKSLVIEALLVLYNKLYYLTLPEYSNKKEQLKQQINELMEVIEILFENGFLFDLRNKAEDFYNEVANLPDDCIAIAGLKDKKIKERLFKILIENGLGFYFFKFYQEVEALQSKLENEPNNESIKNEYNSKVDRINFMVDVVNEVVEQYRKDIEKHNNYEILKRMKFGKKGPLPIELADKVKEFLLPTDDEGIINNIVQIRKQLSGYVTQVANQAQQRQQPQQQRPVVGGAAAVQ